MSSWLETMRRGGGRVEERGERWARFATSRIRPRVSLASGSILVLLTLTLPIGYNACGPPYKGYELAQGKGDWPTLMGVLLSSTVGRDFYILVVSLAAFTTIFVLLSFLNPHLCRNLSLTHRLFVLTGSVSLFLIADVMLLLPAAEDRYGSAVMAIGLVSCVSPGLFWPKKVFWAWLSAMAIAISLLFIVEALRWMEGDSTKGLMLLFAAIYALVPLRLWWWLGISSRGDVRAQWEKIRRGLVAFYFPAALGNLWFLVIAVAEHIWGFVPCYFGIHLMALGYSRLKQERMLPPAEHTSDQA